VAPSLPQVLVVGYECSCERSLKESCGAKSNAFFLGGAHRHAASPVLPSFQNSSASSYVIRERIERSLFRAVVTQSYLLILQGITSISCLILSSLLEPKWSRAVQI